MPYSASGFTLFTGDILTRTDQINSELRRGAEIGGGQSILVDPDDANGGSFMRCFTSGTPDVTPAYHRFKLQHLESGNASASPTTAWDEARALFRCKAVLNTIDGASVYAFRFGNSGADGVVIVSFIYDSASGDLKVRMVVNGVSTDSAAVLTLSTEYDFYVKYVKSSGASDGVCEVWYAAAGGTPALLISDNDHNETDQIGQFDCMGASINKIGNHAIYHRGVGWCMGSTLWASSFTNPADLWYDIDRGLGQLRDPDTTGITVKSCWQPGQYRHLWAALTDMKAGVYIIEGNSWPGDAHGTLTLAGTMDLDENNDFYGHVELTGLTKGQQYIAKVVPYSDATSGTKYWPTRTLLWTQLTDTDDLKVSFGSCDDPSGSPPFEWAEHARGDGSQIFFHLGDQQYEASGLSDTVPWERTEDFLIDRTDFDWERWLDYMSRYVPIVMLPDDHEVANNWDASYRQGYVDAVGNPAGSNGSAYATLAGGSYGGTITLGDLYDECREGFYQAESKGFRNLGHAGSAGSVDRENYRSFQIGNILIAVVDLRAFEDSAGTEPTSNSLATNLGAAQLAWLNTLIDDCTAQTLIIATQSPWSDTNTVEHGDAHYTENAPAERNLIWDRIESNAKIKRFCIICGDMHLNMVTQRRWSGYNNLTRDVHKLAGDFCVGSMGKHAAPLDSNVTVGGTNAASRGVFFFSIHGETANDTIRSRGVLTIPQNIYSPLALAVMDGDDNSLLYSGEFNFNPPVTTQRSRPGLGDRREVMLGDRP